jgi:hypothetical protein
LKCCLNIDKKLIPKTVSLSADRKPKPFERRGLDEKVGSFIYLGFAGVGFGFLFDGIKV